MKFTGNNTEKNIARSIIKKITFTSEGRMKETKTQIEEREAFELKFGFAKPAGGKKK